MNLRFNEDIASAATGYQGKLNEYFQSGALLLKGRRESRGQFKHLNLSRRECWLRGPALTFKYSLQSANRSIIGCKIPFLGP